MTLCVVGCLAKPVCFSKYCDIKHLPSTTALLAIPVGLHRARQRAAYLTPTSLMPAPTLVRIFCDLKMPQTAWQRSWLSGCCYCCFYYCGMSGDQTLSLGQYQQPVTARSLSRLSADDAIDCIKATTVHESPIYIFI